MPVSRRRNVRNRRANSTERSQSRKFFILFFLFLGLSYLTYHITKFQPEKKTPKVMSAQDSIMLMTKGDTIQSAQSDSIPLGILPVKQIDLLSKKLGVIDDLIKIKEKEGQTIISLALNSNLLDLNFANYYFTKKLQEFNWRLLKGEENTAGSMQTLSFLAPNNQRFQINLFYDKSNSYPVQNTKIAIIITELGPHKMNNLISYLRNPYPVSYAIVPYRKYTQTFVQLLGSANVETLINIPMEDINYPEVDHGKNAITVKLKDHEIRQCIKDYQKEIPCAKGAINYLGSLASTDENIMKSTMTALKENNFFFVDNVSSVSTVAFTVAQKMVLPSYRKTLSLNFKEKKENFDQKIEKIKASAGNSQLIIITVPESDLPKPEDFIKFCGKLRKLNYDFIEISSLEEDIFL